MIRLGILFQIIRLIFLTESCSRLKVLYRYFFGETTFIKYFLIGILVINVFPGFYFLRLIWLMWIMRLEESDLVVGGLRLLLIILQVAWVVLLILKFSLHAHILYVEVYFKRLHIILIAYKITYAVNLLVTLFERPIALQRVKRLLLFLLIIIGLCFVDHFLVVLLHEHAEIVHVFGGRIFKILQFYEVIFKKIQLVIQIIKLDKFRNRNTTESLIHAGHQIKHITWDEKYLIPAS